MALEKSYLHALGAFRPFVSSTRLRDLVRALGSARAAWEASDASLETLGWTEEQRTRFNDHRRSWRVVDEAARLEERGIDIVADDDPRFPALLKHIFDPPLLLYVRGSLVSEELAIAVVGSRKATPYGKTATNLLVRPLASRGATIVSGLAYGIDAEAHRATLAVRRRTVAVLGSGVDDASLYPRAHRQLAADIIAAGGAVVSEYAPGTRPQGYFFPQRNRIIAGLSHAIVVVEANEQSGALITARAGLEQNREVFAVPGPITSPLSHGTNALLREGAAPALSAEHVFEGIERFLVLAEPPAAKETPAAAAGTPSDDTAALLNMLSSQPRAIDDLVKMSKLRPNVVASLITVLELDGRVRDVGGRQYIRA